MGMQSHVLANKANRVIVGSFLGLVANQLATVKGKEMRIAMLAMWEHEKMDEPHGLYGVFRIIHGVFLFRFFFANLFDKSWLGMLYSF